MSPEWLTKKIHIKKELTLPYSGGAVKFSNDLSPDDLVDWLSQELTARNLTLEEDVKSRLISKSGR